MKFTTLLTIVGMLLIMAFPVLASDDMMSTSIACPVCHMPMTPHKTAMMTVPLMVHGKKYYCCSMCGAGKTAAAYEKMHPGHLFVAEK